MKQTILNILIIIIFTGCIHESENKTINSSKKEIPNAFIGNWESLERDYPYKSHLIINSDKTFHFEYVACFFKWFFKWEMANERQFNSIK